jgi:hypothetical protein
MLGNLSLKLNDAASLIYYQKVIQIEGPTTDDFYNLANALHHFKKIDPAIKYYTLALEFDELNIKSLNGRGNLYYDINHMQSAIMDFERIVKIEPHNQDAIYNIANCYLEIKNIEKALFYFDKVIYENPLHFEAIFNKALALLTIKQYELGFELYENRWNCKAWKSHKNNFGRPLWKISENVTSNNVVLVHYEQGIGDSIQFIRFLDILKKHCLKVILLIQEELYSLVCNSGFADVVLKKKNLDSNIYFDSHIPLMSLPYALQLGYIDSLKTKILKVPNENKYKWYKRITGIDSTLKKIGIVWMGTNSDLKVPSQRSIELEILLKGLPRIHKYISLQKIISDNDLKLLEKNNIIDLHEDIIDFSDTAAICELVDLVITIDTSVAHLAGSLGVNTWVLLSSSSDWRWGVSSETSSWYSSAKLMRQNSINNWGNVIEDLYESLLKF